MLSRSMWKYKKKNGIEPEIKLKKQNKGKNIHTKKCNLSLKEMFRIIEFSRKVFLQNERSEEVSRYHYEAKYSLY